MQVLYRLASVFANVGDHAIAFAEAKLLCNGGDHGEDVRHNGGIFSGDCISRGDMALGNDQAMHGCLGRNVQKSVAKLVLIYLFRGDFSLDDRTE